MFKSLLPWKHTKTKVMVPEQTMEDENNSRESTLVPCATCGRTFLPLPLRKHAPICEKSASKKRKIFDSLKQRVEGTDLAQFHQRSYLKRQESTPKTAEKPDRASRWEENHQKLVDAIRSAKGATREMSPCKKVQSIASSPHERCPHCERQFGPKAFDRHVEWCKEHRTRVQKSPANVLIAKERLDARIKYKVPPLNKIKKVTVKEKYSGTNVVSRTDSVCSVKSTPPNAFRRNLSVRKPKSVLDLGSKTEQQPAKVEDKTTSVISLNEITKRTDQNKSNSSTPYDPFVSAERQLMELLECDTFKATPSKSQYTLRPHTAAVNSLKPTAAAKKTAKSAAAASKTATKKRASVIDPPACFQDPDDDFEMLENLINDQFNSERDDFFLLDLNNKRNKDDFNVILNQRKYSDDSSSVDSNLINENDNLTIPENFKFGNYSSDDTDTTIQNDNVDFYSVRYDKKIEAHTDAKPGNVKRSPTKIKPKSISSFGSSGDAAHARRRTKEAGSSAKKDTKSAVSKTKTKEKKDKVSESSESDLSIKPEDLFAVDDKMYAEYKIYEEMYLKEKELAANTKKQRNKNAIKSYGIEITSDEYHPPTETISSDSAYGSLNRNSPKPKTAKLSPLQRHRIDSASSSGSENCANVAPLLSGQQRMSKFCHECGNKYPLETAKFCPECGIRRLLL